MRGDQLISGVGPVRVDTNLNSNGITVSPQYKGINNVTITVGSDDPETLLMWKSLFEDSLARYGIPSDWYDLPAIADGEVSLDITGNSTIGVYADITRADYTATLQTVATEIE